MNALNTDFRNAVLIEKDRLVIDYLKQTVSLLAFNEIRIETSFDFELSEINQNWVFTDIDNLEALTIWSGEQGTKPQVILYQTKNGKVINFWNNGITKINDSNLNSKVIYVRTRGKLEKIYKKDILYIESDKKYCTIVTPQKKYVIRAALKSLDKQLSDKQFIRVHRSFLINQEHIQYIDTQNLNIEIGVEKIAIGRRYQEELYNQLMILY